MNTNDSRFLILQSLLFSKKDRKQMTETHFYLDGECKYFFLYNFLYIAVELT